MASQLFDDLVEFLVEVSTADEDTDYAEALLASAKTAISGSGAALSSLISSGLNGKTFSRAVHLSAVEVARACQQAIAIYNDEETEVASTYADFRNLNR
jgi:SOS response regulatory protein OraA/RecX